MTVQESHLLPKMPSLWCKYSDTDYLVIQWVNFFQYIQLLSVFGLITKLLTWTWCSNWIIILIIVIFIIIIDDDYYYCYYYKDNKVFKYKHLFNRNIFSVSASVGHKKCNYNKVETYCILTAHVIMWSNVFHGSICKNVLMFFNWGIIYTYTILMKINHLLVVPTTLMVLCGAFLSFYPLSPLRYLLYAKAVLQLSFGDQIYSGVQGPFVLAGKDDVGSIEPSHLGHFVINITPVGRARMMRFSGTKVRE